MSNFSQSLLELTDIGRHWIGQFGIVTKNPLVSHCAFAKCCS